MRIPRNLSPLSTQKKKERKEEWGVDSAPGGIHTNGSEIKVERE